MRPRTAYTLATACLLLTTASLALWGVSLGRRAGVVYESHGEGTHTWQAIAVQWGIVEYQHSWTTYAAPTGPAVWYTILVPSRDSQRERWSNWSVNGKGTGPSADWRLTRVALAGFGVEHIRAWRNVVTTIHLPLWFTAALPAFLAYRLLRRARRLATPGLCPRCHYDLRIHLTAQAPPRCPECGTALPTTDQRTTDPTTAH